MFLGKYLSSNYHQDQGTVMAAEPRLDQVQTLSERVSPAARAGAGARTLGSFIEPRVVTVERPCTCRSTLQNNKTACSSTIRPSLTFLAAETGR